MNNSVFGKTMENVRNRTDVKLVVTEERRKKLVSEPNYHTCKQFSESLMAIEMRKTELLMDKPIAVRQAILDISKTLMYEFYDDYLKPMYQDRVNLCYMDTDSFILQIQTDDFLKILIQMQIHGLIHLIMIKMIMDLQKQVKTKR